MTRPRRDNRAGDVVHVWARGNNKQMIFSDELDRRLYLVLLGMTVDDFDWRCLAYCLMGNHIHLVVETPKPNLAAGMQDLHGTYARSFNERHGRCNHLFGSRYDVKRIEDLDHLWWATAYVALNPVRAGLCAAPQDWAWSSCAATLGLQAAPWWLDIGPLFEPHGLDPADFAEYVRRVGLGDAEGPTQLILRRAR